MKKISQGQKASPIKNDYQNRQPVSIFYGKAIKVREKVFVRNLNPVQDKLAVYEPNVLVHINYAYLISKKKLSYMR